MFAIIAKIVKIVLLSVLLKKHKNKYESVKNILSKLILVYLHDQKIQSFPVIYVKKHIFKNDSIDEA